MKTFDLNAMGLREMSTLEMKETDGGLIWLLVIAAVALVGTSSCVQGPINIQIGGTNNNIRTEGTATVSADSSSVEIPIDVPIGY
jgi:hypothetical protein